MKNLSAWVMAGIACVSTSAGIAGPKDPRLAPISQQQLEKGINQNPITASKQIELVSQARSSHLTTFAYDKYKKIYKEQPNSANANLLAGIAAENDWQYQTSSSGGKMLPNTPKAKSLLEEARVLLARAVQLEPHSARANMEYGYFLWHNGIGGSNSTAQGFSLIQNSAHLSPKDPTAHALLGDVCSNPFGPYASYYNPTRAAHEYHQAIDLDPLYAYPHLQMVFLTLNLKQYTEAGSQMNQFLRLAPSSYANDQIVKILQASITKGLGRN